MQSQKKLVEKIHQTPHKAVIAATGGGSEAIGELLKYGGGSNTLLEAIVPYHQEAFNQFVKGKPDKYCSPGAARDLAMASFQRAINLTTIKDVETLIGIGVTCSLAKDGERQGRTHRAYVAVQTYNMTRNYDIPFDGSLSRVDEEEIVSQVILGALALGTNEIFMHEGSQPFKLYQEVMSSIFDKYLQNADHELQINGTFGSPEMLKLLTGQTKTLYPIENPQNRVIFSGSFYPFHEGHETIAKKVYETTGKKVDLEICVHNVDKPAINFEELHKRITELEKLKENSWCGDIIFTALPTFMEKAKFFPGTTFVVGWDTFKRINDPKYGNLSEVIDTLKKDSAFIVVHRITDGMNSVDDNLEGIHPEILKLSRIISPDILPPSDISSSKIRAKNLDKE